MIEGNLDDYQLIFWMRPIYATAKNLDEEPLLINNLYAYSGCSVVVGSMTMPDDVATFDSVTICNYPYSVEEVYYNRNVKDDMTGNRYWVKYSIPLKGFSGKYISLNSAVAGEPSGNAAFIDDIIIEPLSTCPMPTDVVVAGLTDVSATISCKVTQGTDVKVKYSTSIEALLDNDDFEVAAAAGGNVILDNLTPNTKYYYRLLSKCSSADSSDMTVVQSFTTPHSVRFYEPFTYNVVVPSAWTRSNSTLADELFDGKTIGQYMQSSDTAGWRHMEIDDFSSAHQVAYMRKKEMPIMDYPSSRPPFICRPTKKRTSHSMSC